MPDPLANSPAMTINKPDSMPRGWWLFPWSYARQLHRNIKALRALCDRQDDLLRGEYTTRPRWKIVPHTHEGVTRYYFQDTEPCKAELQSSLNFGVKMLCDANGIVAETDPAKAIDYCDTLNGGKTK